MLKGIQSRLIFYTQVKELPQPCTVPPEDDVSIPTQDVNKMKIAWRYEGLNQVESSFGSNTNFGHHFDLSRHLDSETINNSNITYWNVSHHVGDVNGKVML